MRVLVLAVAAFALAACTSTGGTTVGSFLVAADAATALSVERLTVQETTFPARDGADPVVALTLNHADGRALAFQQANHTPNDLFVQRPGGALAQIMGLPGEAAPVLYRATPDENRGAPIFCGPEGPALIAYFTGSDGAVQIVGLKQEIQVETRPDGQTEAVPYSPDQVCARLRFTWSGT